jgi:predicted Zn-dependent protease
MKTYSKLKLSPLLMLLPLLILVLACATSPEGRSQLILLPDSQMDQMGVQAFTEMKGKIPIERDPSMNTYVKCVALEVLKESEGYAKKSDWEVVVFRDESANAFALPGGKIGVHSGLLKVAKTQDQLAAVLGHEVGHVIARHGNERVSQSVAMQGALVAGSLAVKEDNPNRNLILAGLGLGAQFGVLLPWGRTQESEADIIGLKIMARAGFNPQESVELWRNMSGQGSHPPEWLSTHPAPGNRIDNLQSHMNEALGLSEAAQRNGRKPNCQKR